MYFITGYFNIDRVNKKENIKIEMDWNSKTLSEANLLCNNDFIVDAISSLYL